MKYTQIVRASGYMRHRVSVFVTADAFYHLDFCDRPELGYCTTTIIINIMMMPRIVSTVFSSRDKRYLNRFASRNPTGITPET